MARKEDLRFIRTNRKLYETFFYLIEKDLIENLSITDICEAAEINRATFYKHFNDHKEFVFYCIEQKVRELRLERTGRENANPTTMLEDCVRDVYALLRLIMELNADNLKPDTEAIRMICDALMAFYLAEFTAQYNKADHIIANIDKETFAAYRAGSLMSLAFFSLMKGPEKISEAACEEVIATFVSKMRDF